MARCKMGTIEVNRESERIKIETETREQTIRKIDFWLPKLTDEELRMVSAFIRGMKKG